MLTDKFLEESGDDVSNDFSTLETLLLIWMGLRLRNLASLEDIEEEYPKWKNKACREFFEYSGTEFQKVKKSSQSKVKTAIKSGIAMTVSNIFSRLKDTDSQTSKKDMMNRSNKNLNKGIKDTQGEIKNLCNVSRKCTNKQFIKACDEAYSKIVAGNNADKAIESSIRKLSQKGIEVVTGWNIERFDIPYIFNRILRVLDLTWAGKLSPWNNVQTSRKKISGGFGDKEELVIDIAGVSILDYMALYKKYVFTKHESYSLGHIAQEELGQTKLDHSEYKNFNEFYEKGFDEKFVEYNIIDTQLVSRLEDKLKLIQLVYTVAYLAKVNFNDVFSPQNIGNEDMTKISSNFDKRNLIKQVLQYKEKNKTMLEKEAKEKGILVPKGAKLDDIIVLLMTTPKNIPDSKLQFPE